VLAEAGLELGYVVLADDVVLFELLLEDVHLVVLLLELLLDDGAGVSLVGDFVAQRLDLFHQVFLLFFGAAAGFALRLQVLFEVLGLGLELAELALDVGAEVGFLFGFGEDAG